MEFLNREIALREKILLLVLTLILLFTGYDRFISKPIDRAIETAKADAVVLEDELQLINSRIAIQSRKREEFELIKENGARTYMPSYNREREEIDFIYEKLSRAVRYSVSCAEPVIENNLVRRNIVINFGALDYATACETIESLECDSQHRVIIQDMSVQTREGNLENSAVVVAISLIMYEVI